MGWVTFWIDILLIVIPDFDPINEFNAADLQDTVASCWPQPSRLDVKHDLSILIAVVKRLVTLHRCSSIANANHVQMLNMQQSVGQKLEL